jgi:hypothetical protein
MSLSRLALALVISLRAVLVYGEATSAASHEQTWADLLPTRLRIPRPEVGAPQTVRALTGPWT